MKTSHTVTPRTLGECQFMPSHDPIEHYAREYGANWWFALIAIGIVTCVLVYLTR